MTIVNLKDVNCYIKMKVNLIGIVVEFSIPRASRGSDFCTTLKLVDKYQQTPEFCVNIFTETIDGLPHIRSQKDIILLSNVRIDLYDENVVATFCKKFSSFALFDCQIGNNFTPYQASSTYHLVGPEQEFIRRLQNWSLSFAFDGGVSEYVSSLKDIGGKLFVDLVCEVLYKCVLPDGKWMLFLWDGTDAPSLSLETKLGDEEHNPLALQIETVSLPGTVLRNFPHVGTVLTATADESYGKLGDHFHGTDHWVRFRNLTLKAESGLWKGVITPRTKISLLSKTDNNSVMERLRNCDERISERGRLPLLSCHVANFLTAVTGNKDVEFATLMDVLTSSQVHHIFKCVARVVSIYPSQAKDYLSPVGHYRIRMTLEDPTARIHALLILQDAELFFGGYPDADIRSTMMKKLLGCVSVMVRPGIHHGQSFVLDVIIQMKRKAML